ncbi:MAG TPA: extracellular solute-binding protein [Geminicoccaceae bacterium]|nr:extracellular solute-binding protein [Geminicoccaceae bacterium]
MAASQIRPVTRREVLKAGSTLTAAGAVGLYAPAVIGQAKPFAGTTLNVSCWSATYAKLLGAYVPEFTEATGIQVNYDTPAFPIYNQRADLELSTQGSAYDVLNLTFIYASRWIGAGWFTPLDEFLNDPNRTPADWGADDFLAGALAPLQDADGRTYALPWTAEAQIGAAARFDLIQAAGLAMPETFDDLVTVLQAVHGKEGIPAYVNENIHHWTWMPFLQGMGGSVFRNAPDDLTPALDTPEAVAAAEYYTNILRSYTPDGVLSYTFDQMTTTLKQGRANYTTANHSYVVQLGDPATSKVTQTVAYAPVPRGPAGRFPQVAVHGWGIPTGARNKDASWEFIKWSMSKEMVSRLLEDSGYASFTRASAVASPAFKEAMTINGQDVGRLYVETVESATDGHMAYRTVHVFPQVGQQISKAIDTIASGQMTAKEALAQAQANAIADLRRAGVKL